jgi:DNA repair photolyase
VLRLPWEVNPLFQQWLDTHFPDRAARVMARVREMRGGRDYDARFGDRMRGKGVWAELLAQRFSKACVRHGFDRERIGFDFSRFRPPRRDAAQAALF